MNAQQQQPISTMEFIHAQYAVLAALRELSIKSTMPKNSMVVTDTFVVELKEDRNNVSFISIEIGGMKYGMKGNFTPENIRKFISFFAR